MSKAVELIGLAIAGIAAYFAYEQLSTGTSGSLSPVFGNSQVPSPQQQAASFAKHPSATGSLYTNPTQTSASVSSAGTTAATQPVTANLEGVIAPNFSAGYGAMAVVNVQGSRNVSGNVNVQLGADTLQQATQGLANSLTELQTAQSVLGSSNVSKYGYRYNPSTGQFSLG